MDMHIPIGPDGTTDLKLTAFERLKNRGLHIFSFAMYLTLFYTYKVVKTCTRSWMSSNFVKIQPLTLELVVSALWFECT